MTSILHDLDPENSHPRGGALVSIRMQLFNVKIIAALCNANMSKPGKNVSE